MRLYNLGVACGTPGDATNFYRAMGPMGALRQLCDGLMLTQMREIQWAFLKTIDGVFMHRPFTPDHLALCKMIKYHRKPLWIDHDDNLFDVGLDNPVFQDYSNNPVKESIAEMLSLADVVSVSTPHLGSIYGRFAKKVIVVPNAIDDDIIDVLKAPTETNRMVFWRGSNTHAKDWASIGDGFLKVAAKHADWKYAFMGYQPWHIVEPLIKALKPENVVNFGGCDIIRYFDAIKHIAPQIMVVPLFAGPFNYSKSNIAWLEGSYAGAITLAPNWAEWDKPGVIQYDASKEPWKDFAEKLESMLVMPEEERLKLHKQSWTYVKNNLLLSRVNHIRKSILTTHMGM